MISKGQALHKAEQQFSQLQALVERAIEESWRVDEFERTSFAKLLDLGLQLLTAVVAAQGKGDEGKEVEHAGKTLQRLEKQHSRRYLSIY